MAKRKRSSADSGHHGGSRRKSKVRATPEPPPPPRYPYDAEKGIPITKELPDVSLIEEPLSVKESFSLSHSLAQSRNKWLSGAMFTKFWTRPPRGRKLAEGEVNAREKMTKLCECLMAIGPHIFDVKLFIVKDESKDDDAPNGSVEPEDKDKQQSTENPTEKVKANAESSEQKKDAPETKAEEESEPMPVPQPGLDPINVPEPKSVPEPEQEEEQNPQKVQVPVSEPESQAEQEPESKPEETSVDNPLLSVSPDPKVDPALTGSTAKTSSGQPVEHAHNVLPASLSKPSESIASNEHTQPVTEDATSSVTDPSLSAPHPISTASNSESGEASNSSNNPKPPSQASPDDMPRRSPTPTAASVASNPNNMATIMKLQAIARIDRSLNSLMKIVASGNATSEQITAFQAYINGARSMELEDIPRFFKPVPEPDGSKGMETTGKVKGKKKDGGPRKPGKPRGRTAGKYQKKTKDGEPVKKKDSKPKNSYVPKKLQKKVTIVFEFKDNPADRYIIPKNSIVEILPTNEVLVSFLLLFPEGGIAVKPNRAQSNSGNIKKEETGMSDNSFSATNEPNQAEEPETIEDDGRPKCFYPLTVTLRNMPIKTLPVLERSVNKPKAVAEYMTETMNSRIRTTNWWVWFQVDKRDEELLSQLVMPAKPPENMFIPARVRVYKSKKKSKEDAEKKKKKKGDRPEDGTVIKPEDEANDGTPNPKEQDTEMGQEEIHVSTGGHSESLDVDPSLLSKESTPQARSMSFTGMDTN